jgi:hypothetical protein
MHKTRKIFFVVASGGHETERHYYETIVKKRTVEESSNFLTPHEIEILRITYHGGPFAVWGAVPGPGNLRTWDAMETGDYVLIYRSGKIIFAAEVALKTRNSKMAEYLWGKEDNGNTWEYMYFLVNPQETDVTMAKLNPYLGYSENFFPRGFSAIEKAKSDDLLGQYGDIFSALLRIGKGKKLEKVNKEPEINLGEIEEHLERVTTEHDEMQWRLIRLGKKTKVDVWVPRNDQGKSYEGHTFRDEVLEDFQETIDVPNYIKNIDVVWKYGYSIKSAFEIEHSTSIYSGILRLSDLRALTPNSTYPLFIVADRSRKNKVFSELQRPTFDNPYLNLKEVIGFLSYDKVREMDENFKNQDANISLAFLMEQSEKVT